MEWPANPFWDYSVALYRQPEVEAACLELQRCHGLDVNLVLLCCWQGSLGGRLDAETWRQLRALVGGWQAEVIRPLRALRQRLKVQLAEPEPGSIPAGWAALAGALRERVLALEIDGERLAQLALTRAVAGRPADAPAGAVGSASTAIAKSGESVSRKTHGFLTVRVLNYTYNMRTSKNFPLLAFVSR
jgi:uncharacterized protein (TIGR02444 family)